jgi:hypothetical protein
MPLADGFEYLSQLEPRLQPLKSEVEDIGIEIDRVKGSHPDPREMTKGVQMSEMHQVMESLSRLVGPKSSATDPLLRSAQTHTVVVKYFLELSRLRSD